MAPPDMPGVFGSVSLPWEFLKSIPERLVYDLQATTIVSLPVDAVLTLRYPLAKIFHALPGSDEGDALPVTRIMNAQQVEQLEAKGFKLKCPTWGGACEVKAP